MFGKVKKWLGIEGVKVEVVLPEEIKSKEQKIEGKLLFSSMHDQVVTYVKVKLVEKYKRGRRKSKLIDEYILGEIELEDRIEVPVDEVVELDFELPFEFMKSDMDQFGEKNIVTVGIAKFAKYVHGVKSEFRLEAEAKVEGTALHPFAKVPIKFS